MLFRLQTCPSRDDSLEPVIAGYTISFATDKTSTCEFFKAPFRYTTPIITDAGKKPLLFEPGLMEHHHLSVTRWTWDLNKGLGIISDREPADRYGCTN
jgi:hypothetical protein